MKNASHGWFTTHACTCLRRIRGCKLEVETHSPAAVRREAEIEAAITSALEVAGPDVVRIRYEIGFDWSGEWAIFFRVVLTDDAAKYRLREAGSKVERELSRVLDFDELGVWAYHNYRSESEQAKVREPAWA